MKSLGFRFGSLPITDVVSLNEAAFQVLEGVDIWIVDCARIAPPHPVHAHLELALEWIKRVRPRRAYLTHMNQPLSTMRSCRLSTARVEPAYDGLVIEMTETGAP